MATVDLALDGNSFDEEVDTVAARQDVFAAEVDSSGTQHILPYSMRSFV